MEENRLGLGVGIVKQALSVTNENGDKVSLTVRIDFSSVGDGDIRSWLAANRVIAGQRPWRKLSKEELEDLDGKTFNAQSIGMKVKSRNEQVQEFRVAFENAGVEPAMALKLATAAVDNPRALEVAQEVQHGEISG